MSVGSIEETITVTGEAPMVDIQSTRQQTQFPRETLESLPTTGRLTGLSQVIPGVTLQSPAQYSVGGINDSAQFTYALHGAPMAEPVVDGMSQVIGITNGVFVFNQATFQEVVVETNGVGADRDTGGMQLNVIQRDGGNRFSGGFGYSYSGPSLESNNVNDELTARNLIAQQCRRAQELLRRHACRSGGPIVRDRLWFFGAVRKGGNQQFQQGNYFNKLQATTPLFYEPDLSRPAATDQYSKDATGRLTWQAARNHKVVVAVTSQPNCNCYFSLLNQFAARPRRPARTTTIPSHTRTRPGSTWPPIESWSRASMQVLATSQQTKRVPGTGFAIQVTDTDLEGIGSYRYGSRGQNLGTNSYLYIPRSVYEPGVNVSYISGRHNFKAGFLLRDFSTGS